jgi:hypothetical protein
MTTQTDSPSEKLAKNIRLRIDGAKRAHEVSAQLDESILQHLETNTEEHRRTISELKLYREWMIEETRIDETLTGIEEEKTQLEKQRRILHGRESKLKEEKARKKREFITVSPF